jgi:hypothetical protein
MAIQVASAYLRNREGKLYRGAIAYLQPVGRTHLVVRAAERRR